MQYQYKMRIIKTGCIKTSSFLLFSQFNLYKEILLDNSASF